MITFQPNARTRPALAALLLALLGGAAMAADTSASRNAETSYRQERAACLDGSSTQDRTTCLKEAGAALAQGRRNTLDNGVTADQLRRNALQRCGAVRLEDREACERMALGEGQRSGSVAAGAVIKQITTRSVEPTAAAASAAAR
jgi:hypothetical protein